MLTSVHFLADLHNLHNSEVGRRTKSAVPGDGNWSGSHWLQQGISKLGYLDGPQRLTVYKTATKNLVFIHRFLLPLMTLVFGSLTPGTITLFVSIEDFSTKPVKFELLLGKAPPFPRFLMPPVCSSILNVFVFVISPTGRYIISGSENYFFYIWRKQMDFLNVSRFSSSRKDRNNCWEAIKAHDSVVTVAVFLPNPDLLLDKRLRRWNSVRRRCANVGDHTLRMKMSSKISTYWGEVIVSADCNGSIRVFKNRVPTAGQQQQQAA